MSTYKDSITEDAALQSKANQGGSLFEIVPNPFNFTFYYPYLSGSQNNQYHKLVNRWKLSYFGDTDRAMIKSVQNMDYTYIFPVLPAQIWLRIVQSIAELPKEEKGSEEEYRQNLVENMYYTVQFLKVIDSSWYKGEMPVHNKHVLVSNNANFGRANYAHAEPKGDRNVSDPIAVNNNEDQSAYNKTGKTRPKKGTQYPTQNLASDEKRVAYCGTASSAPDLEIDAQLRSMYCSASEQHYSRTDLKDSAGDQLNPVAKLVPSSSLFPTRTFIKSFFGTLTPNQKVFLRYSTKILV